MGDTVIRHEVGEAHDAHPRAGGQAHRRHLGRCSTNIRFDLNLVVAGDDGEHVAIVYQSPMKLKDGTENDDRQHGDLPRRRRQDHRSLELRLQARGLAMTEFRLSRWHRTRARRAGLLPAGRRRRRGTRDADGRGPPRRGDGLRHRVHLRAVERQGGVIARRRGVRGHQPDADRHRRNQSQHPPPADHRLVGDHHAPPLRRPVHAGHRPRRRGDVRRVRRARR